MLGRAIRRPLTISAAALLLAGLASTPLHGGATAITLNLSGTSSSSNTSTGFDYVLNGSGPVTPFGTATFTGSGAVAAMSNSAGTVSGSLIVTFGNGDSFQADTPGQFALDAMGNPTATVTAKISGGTGTFNNATGSANLMFSGVTSGAYSVNFTLTGSGTITTPLTAASNVTVDPPALQFAANQVSQAITQTISVNNSTAQKVTFSAAKSAPWISVAPATGAVEPFSAVSIPATADPSGLPPGIYVGDISISIAPGGERFEVHVTLAVGNTTNSLRLSDTGLRFLAVKGGGAPASQSISVLNEGSGTLDFSATASTLSGGNWLSASPGSGSASLSAPGLVTINVDPTDLAIGTYYGEVAFKAPGAPNSPLTVVIILNVFGPAQSPGPSLSATGLFFVAQAGGKDPAAQNIVVTNPSPNPLAFGATAFQDSAAVFTTGQLSGTVNAGSPVTISVQTTIQGLNRGVYRGELDVTFSDSTANLVFKRRIILVLIVTPATGSAAIEPAASSVNSVCTPTMLVPVFTQLGDGFQVSAGWPARLEVTVVDDCGAYTSKDSVVTGFSSGDPAISLTSLNDGRWTGTWNPHGASAMQVTITANAQETQPALQGSAQIEGGLAANPAVPVVSSGGVVSAASNAAHQPVGPGSYISIYGSGFSQATHVSKNLPLPASLAGTQALIGGKPVPLYFTSAGQINGIVPFNVSVNTTQQLLVSANGALSLPEPIVLATAQPAIFTRDQTGRGLGVIVGYKPHTSTPFLIDSQHPVSAGDTLVIYCTGLGPVDQPIAAGSPGPSSPPAKTLNPVTATIGGKNASVKFSGIAPVLAVYQVNVVVPSGVPTGNNVPVVLSVRGLQSEPVTIIVK
jgi:uncharacterized protein (TIGR03437 family)